MDGLMGKVDKLSLYTVCKFDQQSRSYIYVIITIIDYYKKNGRFSKAHREGNGRIIW